MVQYYCLHKKILITKISLVSRKHAGMTRRSMSLRNCCHVSNQNLFISEQDNYFIIIIIRFVCVTSKLNRQVLNTIGKIQF